MSQVEELGLQDRVIFGGKMADVRPLLGMSQLSVLASTAVETFSIAMLESMAMRVPVLATNIGGLHEAITPGQTGDLMEPGHVEEMSVKIRSLMTDQAKCAEMGNTAQDLIMRKFTNESMAEQMRQLFVDVASSAR
jgi:glycosyltransferase involved in cell wall biosynthesis